MTEKVVIEITEKDLIKIIAKHFDLKESKTTIQRKHIGINTDGFPTLLIESDRERQSETKSYSQYDR